MNHMLIAFAGEKTRQRMTDIFESTGIHVSLVSGSGGEILRWCQTFESGVILCGYKLLDMTAEDLFECLPPGFSMVLLAPQAQLEMCESEEIFRLAAPARQSELVGSVQMLLERQQQKEAPVPKRSEEDMRLINQAKELLMTRNQMTESQAHRFLQKRSMDTGAKMVQTAMLVLDGQLVI